MKRSIILLIIIISSLGSQAQQNNPGSNHANRFEDLGYLLSTPNIYRTASGAPGPQYWQQRADYDIAVELDEPNNILTGSETVTYYNNSPNPLSYIWLQIDENYHNPGSDDNRANPSRIKDSMSDEQLTNLD